MDTGGVLQGLAYISIPNQPKDFVRAVLHHPEVRSFFPNRSALGEWTKAATRFLKVPSIDDLVPAARNAERDFYDPSRCAAYLKSWLFSAGAPRAALGKLSIDVDSHVVLLRDGNLGHVVDWRLSCDDPQLKSRLESLLPKPPTILAEAGSCNEAITMASTLGCDIWPTPQQSGLIGDKLLEIVTLSAKTYEVVEELQRRVEFPDIRALVNEGILNAAEYLLIRKRASRFRQWLQSEGERDRDAILAYHNEVVAQSGLAQAVHRGVHLFAVVGSAVAGAKVAAAIGQNEQVGLMAGAASGEALKYLADTHLAIASKGWRPIFFGDWLRAEVGSIVAARSERPR